MFQKWLKAFASPIILLFSSILLQGHWKFTAWKRNTDFIFELHWPHIVSKLYIRLLAPRVVCDKITPLNLNSQDCIVFFTENLKSTTRNWPRLESLVSVANLMTLSEDLVTSYTAFVSLFLKDCKLVTNPVTFWADMSDCPALDIALQLKSQLSSEQSPTANHWSPPLLMTKHQSPLLLMINHYSSQWPITGHHHYQQPITYHHCPQWQIIGYQSSPWPI